MGSINDKTGYYAVILFFIWPLLALISAFKNYKGSWGKNILWAFVAFYGFVFAIGAESQGSDIVRYVAEIERLHSVELSMTDAIQYYQESGSIDVLKTFLAVTVSRFTDSQAIVTMVYGIIFGFFFSRNIWYVFERLEGRLKPIVLILLVCLFFVIPIWQLNGFRFWTAAHVFIYGLLPYLFEGKKSGLFTASLSILVHYTFLIPVAVLFGYLLMGNRVVIYFAFFIGTFFISEINLAVFNDLIESYAPEVVQERTTGYRNEGKVEAFREGTLESQVWYAAWYMRAFKWSVMGFLVILFIKGRSYFMKNNTWLSLFSFILLFYGVANLFSSIPSGGRFLQIANLLSLVLIILFIQNREQSKTMERFVWAATPALLFYLVVAVRIGLYSMSATSIIGNPIIAIFFMGEHISLNDMMKMIL
jgi:hypothetical protein